MATILDGQAVAASIQREVAAATGALRAERGIVPTLAVVLVGDDPASSIYVRRKTQACREAGIEARDHLFPGGLSEASLLALVRELSNARDVHGILVQLPLPKGIDEARVLDAIDPAKDVDGFHPQNLGRLLIGQPIVVPGTPAGIMAILEHYGIGLRGRLAAVVGRSRIVGKPVAQLLLGQDATVTMAHSKTPDLAAVTRQADVLVVATGRAHLVGAAHVKPGATVIDVGVNRLPDGTLTGDVDFAAVSPIASAITPVPGGVGPTTVAMLMRNTLRACRRQLGD
ncbi:MAG: bifunctional 5,10-methylenetetrahydrofolate dehydrogenase/5,10-methenyltetrahydrofolate cyclohydrolase [Candidatus Rokuibacteriota bacterium]